MLRLALGAVCIGFAPIFVKLMTMAPTPLALYRCALAALFLSAYLAVRQPASFLSPRFWSRPFLMQLTLCGALFAIDLFVWHRSVLWAGAGLATILGNTQVFYVALAGRFFYQEKLSGIFLLSILLAFAGILLLSNPGVGATVGGDFGMGVVFGLMTGIIYATYILSMRRLEILRKEISLEITIAAVSFFAALFLFGLALLDGSLRAPTPSEWLWLSALAFVAQVAGWLLITKSLAVTKASKAGLVINLQPVVAVIFGNLILHETLTVSQTAGALLTLVAIYLGARK